MNTKLIWEKEDVLWQFPVTKKLIWFDFALRITTGKPVSAKCIHGIAQHILCSYSNYFYNQMSWVDFLW